MTYIERFSNDEPFLHNLRQIQLGCGAFSSRIDLIDNFFKTSIGMSEMDLKFSFVMSLFFLFLAGQTSSMN